MTPQPTQTPKGWNFDLFLYLTMISSASLQGFAAIYHWGAEAVVPIALVNVISSGWKMKRSGGKADPVVGIPTTPEPISETPVLHP